MPELPEVETVRLQLEKFLVGHKILSLDIKWPKIFEGDPGLFIGSVVISVRRFAKVLVVDFNNGYSLIIQIKLTGQLIYKGPNLRSGGELSNKVLGGLGGKHTHLIFKLDKGGVLYYNDVRKFGRIRISESKNIDLDSFIGKLGPEPVRISHASGRPILTLDMFKKILAKTTQPIKILLMDQSKLSGIGNIYANDALWLAKINPRRPANKINPNKTELLLKSINTVLKKGIKKGGASELAFVTPDGSEGHYQDFTLVYGKEGKPCKNNCGSEIKKIKLGGRGTYYCPLCQK